MSQASPGYLPGPTYPTTYFRELSPIWLNYVAALGGAAAPDTSAPFRYLELGCGAGLSSAVHAAAFPQGEFHLCDFDPSAMAQARRHTEQLGAGNTVLHATPFEDLLASRPPRFDYVVLHGVYTWVTESQRQVIDTLIRELLAPGGLLYLSYNCLPGWAPEMPLVRLTREVHAATSLAEPARALDVLDLMAQTGFRYFADAPATHAALTAYRRADEAYLAHELLTDGWSPMYSLDLHQRMAAAGSRYLGSATLADNHPALTMNPAAARLIGSFPRSLRQLAMDFATNRRFRRDVFQMAGLSALPQDPLLGPAPALDTFDGAHRVPRGKVHFDAGFLAALERALASPPQRMSELIRHLADQDHDPAAVRRNLHFAVAAGLLSPWAHPPVEPAHGTAPAFGSPGIERCLRAAASERTTVRVPSPAAGQGIEITPVDAADILAAVESGAATGVSERYRVLGILC